VDGVAHSCLKAMQLVKCNGDKHAGRGNSQAMHRAYHPLAHQRGVPGVEVLLWASSKLAARWASQTTIHAPEAPTTLLKHKPPRDSTDKSVHKTRKAGTASPVAAAAK
jgi:hypothetical protein